MRERLEAIRRPINVTEVSALNQKKKRTSLQAETDISTHMNGARNDELKTAFRFITPFGEPVEPDV